MFLSAEVHITQYIGPLDGKRHLNNTKGVKFIKNSKFIKKFVKTDQKMTKYDQKLFN